MRLALLATGTDSVAVGVTVVATLLVVALVVAVGYLLRAVREMRRRVSQRPEGRWSLVVWGNPAAEALAVFQASLLLKSLQFLGRTSWRYR